MESDDKILSIAMLGQKTVPSRDGGVEVVVEELSAEFARRGHKVTLFNRKRKHEKGKSVLSEYKGVKIKEVFTVNRRSFDAFLYAYFATRKIKKLAKSEKFDILHFHAEGVCAFLHKLPKKEKRNYKIVVTIHGIDWKRDKWKGISSKVIKHCEKQAVKYADEIIVLSENVKKYFKDTYNRETVFIPNGVNIPKLISPNLIKTQFGLDKDGYLLCVSRIVPEKGIIELIEAWRNLSDKKGKKLVIVGGEAHSKDYYQKVVSACKNDDTIILAGFIKGEILGEFFSNAYLYVQPSNLEGMAMALLEARAYGNNCLVSNIPENIGVIGEDDYVFSVGNTNDLSQKLKEIIELNLTTHKKQYQPFSWQEVADKTLEVYSGE